MNINALSENDLLAIEKLIENVFRPIGSDINQIKIHVINIKETLAEAVLQGRHDSAITLHPKWTAVSCAGAIQWGLFGDSDNKV